MRRKKRNYTKGKSQTKYAILVVLDGCHCSFS